jgi:protein-disulfide isomerase
MKKILLIFVIFLSSCSPSDDNKKSDKSSNNAIEISGEIKRISVGNIDAKIIIIAYESLTCSHCADFHKDVYPQLKKEYIDTGLAKIEFRHFPLDIAAFNASKISQCKQDQGLNILESLYSDQQAWVKGGSEDEINKNLKKFINQKGFNIDFDKCVNNKEVEDFVLNDRIEGAKNFDVNATPTIIINNKKFDKSLNYKNLKKFLEKLI